MGATCSKHPCGAHHTHRRAAPPTPFAWPIRTHTDPATHARTQRPLTDLSPPIQLARLRATRMRMGMVCTMLLRQQAHQAQAAAAARPPCALPAIHPQARLRRAGRACHVLRTVRRDATAVLALPSRHVGRGWHRVLRLRLSVASCSNVEDAAPTPTPDWTDLGRGQLLSLWSCYRQIAALADGADRRWRAPAFDSCGEGPSTRYVASAGARRTPAE